jgi:cytochrome c peroxidase
MTVRTWGMLFAIACLVAVVAAQPACKKKAAEPQGTANVVDVAPLPPPPAADAATPPPPPPAQDAAPAPVEAATAMDMNNEPIKPLPPVSELNLDPKKVVLGKRLFHDPILSADGTVSCASCHSLNEGGADPRPHSMGVGGKEGGIQAPTVLNSGFNFVQFWNGRAANLEEQAGGPVANPIEMAGDWGVIVAALGKDETYVKSFEEAFPGAGINPGNIRAAIAEYEKSLVTPSRFDAYLRGDMAAITDEERSGYELFKSVGCVQCHGGVNVGGAMYAKMGVANDYFAARGGELTDADLGRFTVTQNEADRFQFKVPTLRNIEATAPYFHDATQEALAKAVAAMAHFQLGRELTEEEQGKIIAFLKALTGEIPPEARVEAPAAANPDPAAPAPAEGTAPAPTAAETGGATS